MKSNSITSKWRTWWKKLSSGSINRQIFGAAVTIGLLTGLVKFGSVGKELVVAWRFGTGDELDAFLIAMVVPTFIITVVVRSFKVALIPVYIKVREQQGQKAVQQLFSGVMVWALGLLTVIAVIMAIAAPGYLPLLASGFNPEKLELTTRLLWAISPAIVLAGLINIWGGVLNAGESFALVAISPAIIPLATVILLFAFSNWGIFALAVGLICGYTIEIIILSISLRKQNMSLLPKWSGFDDNLRQVASQYVPAVIGAFLMGCTTLVDQSMAAMLPAGSVAALGYANRVIALPLSLLTLALGTAAIPYFSQTIAQKNWSKIEHTLKYYLRLIFITTIPLTIIFILASKLMVQLLFERGTFTAEDTQLVSQIQICYALRIPFYISGIFVVRLINSLGINHFLAWGSSINLFVNVVANYIFMHWIGVKGIALSTSLVSVIASVFLYVLTSKHLQRLLKQKIV